MLRVFPGVDQHDGAGADALGAGAGERVPRGVFVQGFDFLAIDADTTGDFNDFLVQHRWQGDGEIEQPRPGLVADAQRVGEAAVHHQQRALALALQQCVGGDGGAHLHRRHHALRDRRIERHAKHGLDAGDGGVTVSTGVFTEQLVGGERLIGMARDDIGERAAAIDPELPFAGCHQVKTFPSLDTLSLRGAKRRGNLGHALRAILRRDCRVADAPNTKPGSLLASLSPSWPGLSGIVPAIHSGRLPRPMAGTRCYGGGRSRRHVSCRLSKTNQEHAHDRAACGRNRLRSQ